MKEEQKNPIQVVERMMRLLDVLEKHPEPLGLKQITLDHHLQNYAWHSHHHLAHITELRRREGW